MNEEIFISLEDLKRLYRRHKRVLFKAALCTGFGVLVYLLLTPPAFVAEATFKQSVSKTESSLDLKNLFRSLTAQDDELSTVSMMMSHKLLRRTIEELGWQAEVSGYQKGTVLDNLRAELGMPLPEQAAFSFQQVFYSGETKKHLYLRLQAEDTYEILDREKRVLATAKLGARAKGKHFALTLVEAPKKAEVGVLYDLTLLPARYVTTEARKNFSIKPSPVDRSLLCLKFKDSNRKKTIAFLNQIVASYQNFLKEENQAIADAQLTYLDKRQQELNSQLDLALQEHVSYLQNLLGEKGFIGLEQGLEMLYEPQELYTSKLFDVDFEISHLSEADIKSLERAPLTASLNLDPQKSPIYASALEPNFQGLDLESARKLHVQYHGELDKLTSDLKQLLYLQEHIHDRDCELSSLVNILPDTVTQEMVKKAGDLELQLHDALNRSEKEHERVREALTTQKQFIANHIAHSIQLQKIQADLTKEKVLSLQALILKLLKTEKQLIEEKLQEIKGQMSDLPEKWRLENLLRMKTELIKGMMEGLIHLTETKTLSRHLFNVESRPVDIAFAALTAQRPNLFLFSLGGTLLGFIVFYLYFLFQGLFRGLPASLDHLKLAGSYTCGPLSTSCDAPLSDLPMKDLETLRHFASFLIERKTSQGIATAILGERNPDFSRNLAAILALRGEKSVIVDCNFDKVVLREEVPGLWHYLTDQMETAQIRTSQGVDFIPSGGTTSLATELFTKPRFSALIAQLKERYSCVLLVSRAPLDATEAEELVKHADTTLVTVCEEALDALTPYRALNTPEQTRVAFMQFERA